ncbi:hypothetical protein pdul_cds_1022 [Pandoravirus dulcis]|uniref:Uncharacterized protein n=1 Tax=Pandoravirus dulcis TaxID=1349409 RepID=S4VSB3_9VIRU|nr:hypothetical protein pdul_cds_1022 [Pandoravirus dulcis]AGO83293.2 hypothetical protein pdul_cds_1022 [Pandoravirus dulcis]
MPISVASRYTTRRFRVVHWTFGARHEGDGRQDATRSQSKSFPIEKTTRQRKKKKQRGLAARLAIDAVPLPSPSPFSLVFTHVGHRAGGQTRSTSARAMRARRVVQGESPPPDGRSESNLHPLDGYSESEWSALRQRTIRIIGSLPATYLDPEDARIAVDCLHTNQEPQDPELFDRVYDAAKSLDYDLKARNRWRPKRKPD